MARRCRLTVTKTCFDGPGGRSNRTSISSIRHPREGLGEARDSPSDPASRFANWMARAVDPKTLCVLCAFVRTKLFRAKTQRRKEAKKQRHEERKSWIPAYAGMTMKLGRKEYSTGTPPTPNLPPSQDRKRDHPGNAMSDRVKR